MFQFFVLLGYLKISVQVKRPTYLEGWEHFHFLPGTKDILHLREYKKDPSLYHTRIWYI